MTMLAAALLAICANDDPGLDLASALARRGWVELAEELCDRLEKNPAAGAGLPLVRAEVAIAKARVEADAFKAAKELELALERLNRAGHAPTLDERGMTGWLHVQKARILTAASENDAARRAWESAAAFYRGSLVELGKLPAGREVDEAIIEARLELPKSLAALARVDPERAKQLHTEAVGMFADFLFGPTQPILLEALFEEGRSRSDLGDLVRAERCFRGMSGMARDLKKRGFPNSEYQASLLQSGVLALTRTLTAAKKAREAVAACDEFLRENPRLARTPIGYAIVLSKADALYELKDEKGAIDLALSVVKLDPEGAAGRTARASVRKWMSGSNATPERIMIVADGLIERGEYREALIDLRRGVELCATAADRAKVEPVAAYKRGECFRALKQDAEAAVAFQDVFRRYPAHELAKRAAFEAVRSLSRVSAATGDKKDEEQMEKLLDEIERLGLQGEAKSFLEFLRAEAHERKGQFKAAADRFIQVDEACEVFDDAMVSAGHCYRIDAEQRWEKARGAAGLRDELVKQVTLAETALKRVLPHKVNPRLLFTAYHELALLGLHELLNHPKDSLGYLEKCSALLPQDSPMQGRLWEAEVLALLALKDVEGAAARVDQMMKQLPDAIPTLRACRRVGYRLEESDLAKSARYYRFWLEHSGGLSLATAEIQTVADGLYRAARTLNGLDVKVASAIDLKGKPLADPAIWKDAAQARERLLQDAGLSEKDADVASTLLVWCFGFSGDWDKSKLLCEKVFKKQGLLTPAGALIPAVLKEKGWLARVYYEYGHSLFQLGKAGQKFQYTNAYNVFNQLLDITAKGSEPWWVARYLTLRTLFERGEGRDIQTVDAILTNLQRNAPAFDEGKFGWQDKFVELRDQVRAVVAPQR